MWVVAACAVLVAVVAGRSAAEEPAQTPAPQAEAISSSAGVYTSDQAERGEKTFSINCTGCHTTSNYTEAAFKKAWNGRTLSELFTLISETMPEDFPGGLSPKEYADIVAYLLQLNRAPTGQRELTPDVEALRKIRLDLGSQGSPLGRPTAG